MTGSSLELGLELCWEEEDTVSGEVRRPDGSAVPFSGWLGLLGVLERLRDDPPESGGSSRGDGA